MSGPDGDIERAHDLIRDERYREALDLVEPHARGGDARAQVLLGSLRETGRGCNADYVAAEYWYGEAADQQYRPGQFSLGSLYHRRGQRDRAMFFYRRAAEQEILPAFSRLATNAFRQGQRSEGLRLLREAKQRGHLVSALRLAGLALRHRAHGPVERAKALIELPLLALRFMRTYLRDEGDDRVRR